MKMYALKDQVFKLWRKLNSWKGELTSPPQNYVSEICGYGDRRYKRTWINALCRLYSTWLYETTLDSHMLITHGLNFHESDSLYPYRHQILDEFLMFEDGLDIIRHGLEVVFTTDDFTTEEREDVKNNGVLRLLATGAGNSTLGASINPIR